MVSRDTLKELRKEGFILIPRACKTTEGYLLEEVFKNGAFWYLHFNRGTKQIEYMEYFIEGDRAYIPVEDFDGIEHHQLYLGQKPMEYGSTEELRREILEFIPQWVDYSPKFVELDSYYVFLTWLYDRLPVVPYRRALGEVGSGKSRWAETVGGLCRLGFKQGATATAPGVFRKNHYYQGTQIFDENEYNVASSEVMSAINLVLNSGYSETTGMVTRLVGALYLPQGYYTFGPKLIAARTRTGNIATESRIITNRSYKSNAIPREYNKDFFITAQKLRNKLLKWRLDNYEIELTRNKEFDIGAIKRSIDPRLLEVTGAITKFIPPSNMETLRALKDVLVHNNEMYKAVREISMEAACLRGLLAVMERAEPLTMGRISKHLDSKEEETLALPWTARRVGIIFRNQLDLIIKQQYNRVDDNRVATLLWTEENKQELKRRFRDFELDTEDNIKIVDNYTVV